LYLDFQYINKPFKKLKMGRQVTPIQNTCRAIPDVAVSGMVF